MVEKVLKRFGYQPVPQKRNGGFWGALQTRLTSDWIVTGGGPNQDLFGSITLLRDRARDLEKNNPLVRRYLHLLAENVIGPTGIKLQAKAESKRSSDTLEAVYRDWGCPEHYSVDGRMGRVAFDQSVIKAIARDGEVFVRKVKTGEYGLSLQMIDPALVDETYNREATDTSSAIKLGIEVDRWDRPLAYHCLTAHRWDVTAARSLERVRVPASEILHLFIQRRPGQVRGESWLAPVMIALRMLDGYAEAELVAARTAAAKMGFIVSKNEDGTIDPDAPQRSEMEAAPGVIDYLNPGEEFQEWDPTHPSQNFALFVKQIEKFIAAGLNVSFASLTGDLVEVNFASSRSGFQQERDAYRCLHSWFIEGYCEPLFREWSEIAWMKGKLPLRMIPKQYDHTWQPRGWGYTNPQQEMQADLLAIAGGIKSPKQIIGENGDDPETILNEIAEWQNTAKSLGVTLFVPNSVIDPNAQANGSADPDDADRPGSDGRSVGGRRPDPGIALLRHAR